MKDVIPTLIVKVGIVFFGKGRNLCLRKKSEFKDARVTQNFMEGNGPA